MLFEECDVTICFYKVANNMLNDFFHLNGETYELDNQESFEDRLKTSNS
ncbi:hypothetical protein EVA_03893, partial [gut metagenome]